MIETVFNPISSTITLRASPRSARVGQIVTFTARVASAQSGAGTPTGRVSFQDGGATLGFASLDALGVATFRTWFSTAGKHTITAIYSGDNRFSGNATSLIESVLSTAHLASHAEAPAAPPIPTVGSALMPGRSSADSLSLGALSDQPSVVSTSRSGGWYKPFRR